MIKLHHSIQECALTTLWRISEQYGDIHMKLSVDGKKISRGKGKPYLEDRKTTHKEKMGLIENLFKRDRERVLV
jgi:hypothetical protein